MVLGFGFLALFVTLLGLGLLWPRRANVGAEAWLWGLMVKSLFLSWLLFLVSYYSPIGSVMRWIIVALGLAGAGMLAHRWRTQPPLPEKPIGVREVSGLLLMVVALAALTPVWDAFLNPFLGWDSVVSWNRWAIELSNNTYAPQPAAYPVLLPGVWSLIYEAQQNAHIWGVVRSSLIVPFVAFAILLCSPWFRGRWAVSLGALMFLFVFILPDYRPTENRVTGGFMDWPVAVFCSAAVWLMISALAKSRTDADQRGETVLLSLLTASLAAVIKQPGMIVLGLCLLTALVVAWQDGSRRYASIASYILIAAIPLGTFLFLFYSTGRPSAVGNLEYLTSLSDRVNGADRLLASFNKLRDQLPLAVAAGGIIVSVVGIWGRTLGQTIFRVLVATCIVIGFLIYAECCSYGRRNGIWIYGLMLPLFGEGCGNIFRWLGALTPKFWQMVNAIWARPLLTIPSYLQRSAAPCIALAAITMTVGIAAFWPIERQMQREANEHAQQRGQHHKGELALLYGQIETLSDWDNLVSGFHPLQHLPDFKDKHIFCRRQSIDCFTNTAERLSAKNLAFFVDKTKDVEDSQAFISRATAQGRVSVLADTERFILIGIPSISPNASAPTGTKQ